MSTLCCVPVRRDPPPRALGPGKQRSVIVHRRHLKLWVTFFLGFLNVSVSVAYYFLFKRDYLVDFRFMNMDVFWEFCWPCDSLSGWVRWRGSVPSSPPLTVAFSLLSLWLLPHCSIDNGGSCCRGASLPAGETSVWISPAGTISLLNRLLLFMEHIGVCATRQ